MIFFVLVSPLLNQDGLNLKPEKKTKTEKLLTDALRDALRTDMLSVTEGSCKGQSEETPSLPRSPPLPPLTSFQL